MHIIIITVMLIFSPYRYLFYSHSIYLFAHIYITTLTVISSVSICFDFFYSRIKIFQPMRMSLLSHENITHIYGHQCRYLVRDNRNNNSNNKCKHQKNKHNYQSASGNQMQQRVSRQQKHTRQRSENQQS